ncbi:MAG: energy transducer TonB [Fibromonadales bacterium]|nr:energy transducer TonB [Fibromonadales bacterium]
MLIKLHKFGVLLIAAFISSALIFSIPVLNLFLTGKLFVSPVYTATEVHIIKNAAPEPPKPEKIMRKPNRMNTGSSAIKSGPRFAMDLGVTGGSGSTSVPLNLIAEQSGGGSFGSGDVDEKPSIRGAPNFQAPSAIRDREIDATLRLSFCVDVNGRPYDVRVLEESPSGLGLAAAGREALSRSTFKPARKDGRAVPFCGLEQPFEIRFRD